MPVPPSKSLLDARTALIFLIGVVVGLVVGWLSFLAWANVPSVVLIGVVMCAAAVWMSNRTIDD